MPFIVDEGTTPSVDCEIDHDRDLTRPDFFYANDS